eukprot:TRINITY_DN15111_c0_g1_i1.p1 TRINITY_DN15111_c0_g1~~TRINITY_DN15111_c0_g1_i1.p1  ORF type:complete len:167 (-),score=10.89 TRINITY_DN15111_c0_g1_i1:53-553(-)
MVYTTLTVPTAELVSICKERDNTRRTKLHTRMSEGAERTGQRCAPLLDKLSSRKHTESAKKSSSQATSHHAQIGCRHPQLHSAPPSPPQKKELCLGSENVVAVVREEPSGFLFFQIEYLPRTTCSAKPNEASKHAKAHDEGESHPDAENSPQLGSNEEAQHRRQSC